MPNGLINSVFVDIDAAANPSSGRYVWGLDTDGILRKKDSLGVKTPVSEADLNDKVKSSVNDTTEGYLADKLGFEVGKITLTIINPGGNEQIVVGIGADVFDKTSDTSDDVTEGSTSKFVTADQEAALAGTQGTPNAGNPYVTDQDPRLNTTFTVTLDAADSNVTRVEAAGRTSFTVTHSLGTLDVITELYRLSDGRSLGWRVERTGINTIVFSRAGSVANGQFRVVIR